MIILHRDYLITQHDKEELFNQKLVSQTYIFDSLLNNIYDNIFKRRMIMFEDLLLTNHAKKN